MDYCRLPEIQCSKRYGNQNSYFKDPKMCTMLNPDQIQKTFSGLVDTKQNIDKYKVCYQNYPTKGRPGDYKCQIKNNKCVGKPIGCNEFMKIKSTQQPPHNFDYVPKDILCMPPNIDNCPKDRKNGIDPKLYINNKAFYQCQKKNGEVDPMCISNIYTLSNYGFPIDQSNSKILYSESFKKPINNKRVVSCPANYHVCGDNMCCQKDNKTNKINKCLASEHSTILGSPYSYCDYGNNKTNLFTEGAPKLSKFQSERQCLSWCANHPDCKAMVKTLDRSGNLQCRYYMYDTQDNRIKMVNDRTASIYNKRLNRYVANPDEKILPKYDYNLVTKDNILDGCKPYGCCADGTQKADQNGSNCSPFTDKSRLIGDPKYKFSSLGGTTKVGKIDSLSGNSYKNY